MYAKSLQAWQTYQDARQHACFCFWQRTSNMNRLLINICCDGLKFAMSTGQARLGVGAKVKDLTQYCTRDPDVEVLGKFCVWNQTREETKYLQYISMPIFPRRTDAILYLNGTGATKIKDLVAATEIQKNVVFQSPVAVVRSGIQGNTELPAN